MNFVGFMESVCRFLLFPLFCPTKCRDELSDEMSNEMADEMALADGSRGGALADVALAEVR